MRGTNTNEHCVTNMAAGKEAAIVVIIAAMFLLNKEEEESMKYVLVVLFTKEGRHIPLIRGYAVAILDSIRNILFILPMGAEWMEWRSVHFGI